MTMNEELTKLFDNMPEGVVLVSKETKEVKLANSEFKKLFGVLP